MNEARVAVPYAKSLIGLAQEKGVLDQVEKDMSLFVKINEENPEFSRLLRNPVISHDKKRGILNALLKNKVNALTLSIFDLISKKNREEYLYFIAKEFQRQYKNLKGIQSAEVITTLPLSETQRDNFVQIIKEVSGKKVVDLKESIDESIIGGFILKIGDRQVDQSVRSKLYNLKNKFKDNPYIAKY